MGEDAGRFFLTQMVESLDYMHTKRVVHRDLKLENILLDDKLNLHGNGLTNRITLKFVSGAGVIFLDYFQVHAKIADMPAPAMGFPLIA